jgi:gas vesicle protein
MPSVRFLTLAATGLVLAACSSASDRQDAQTSMAASWTSTAVLMLDSWLSGAVPSHYARRTSQTVSKKISDLAADTQEGQPEFVSRQQQMRQVMETLRRAERGIEASDLAAVEDSRNALAAAASRFRKQAPRQ